MSWNFTAVRKKQRAKSKRKARHPRTRAQHAYTMQTSAVQQHFLQRWTCVTAEHWACSPLDTCLQCAWLEQRPGSNKQQQFCRAGGCGQAIRPTWQHTGYREQGEALDGRGHCNQPAVLAPERALSHRNTGEPGRLLGKMTWPEGGGHQETRKGRMGPGTLGVQ